MKDLTPFQPSSSSRSPFDRVRQVRADGSEFWSARELMPMLGYTTWHTFITVIERAMVNRQKPKYGRDQPFYGGP